MSFNRTQILELDDLEKVKIEIPEWGGDFFVAVMSGLDRERFEQSHINNKDSLDFRARLVVYTLCHLDNSKVFTEEDIDCLNSKSSKILDKIFAKAIEINKVTAKDIEEIQGKS